MRLTPLPTASLAVALLAMPTVASAWCRTRSVEQPTPTVCGTAGVLLAWQGACVTVHVNPAETAPGIPRDFLRLAVEEGVRAWNAVPCGGAGGAPPTFQLLVGDDVTHRVEHLRDGPNVNVITWRPVWGRDAHHDPSALAITTVSYGGTSGVILDADIEMNAHPMTPFSVDGGPNTSDVRTVVVHELGHVLGLAHSADQRSLMYYRVGVGERRRVPNADDVAGLCAVYPPWRAARCDPELRREALEGGGLTCAAGPWRAGRGGVVAGLVLAVLGWRRRRARAGSGGRTSTALTSSSAS